MTEESINTQVNIMANMDSEAGTDPLNNPETRWGQEESTVDVAGGEFAAELEECFALVDTHNKGWLDTHQLALAARVMGLGITDPGLAELLGKHGRTTFATFCREMSRLRSTNERELLEDAFATFDTDNEGVIPAHRLKKLLTTLGEALTEKEARALVKLGDPEGRGLVNYLELARKLLA